MDHKKVCYEGEEEEMLIGEVWFSTLFLFLPFMNLILTFSYVFCVIFSKLLGRVVFTVSMFLILIIAMRLKYVNICFHLYLAHGE